MEIRPIETLTPFKFSTKLSNEIPYRGLYREEVKTEQGNVREMLIYLPEGMRRSEYFVTIALPDREDVEAYIERSGWLSLADKKRTGLFFLVPEDGCWKSLEEEGSYLKAVRMAGGNPFTGFRYNSRRTEYLFGAGEGGAVLEQWAAGHPMDVIAQVYINTDVSENKLRELSSFSYSDDMRQPAHPESRVRPVFEDLPADRIPVATALFNSPTEAYWTEVNADNPLAAAENLVWLPEDLSYDDPEDIEKALDFMTSFTRGRGDSAHADRLSKRLDYEKAKAAGQLFEVFDFIQRVDNTGNDQAKTPYTDWKRNYIVYIPEKCWDYKTVRYPVYYFFSGGNTPSHDYFDEVDVSSIAEKYGFIAVVPSSVNGWNTQDGSWPPTIDPKTGSISDDIAFMDSLFTKIEEDFNVDPGRVYITGHSMGSIFCNYLGMQLGDRITAIGACSGPLFDAAVYNEAYSKGTGYQYTENALETILPAMFIFGERDNWPVYIGAWDDAKYETWYGGMMNALNPARRFNDVYYSFSTQEYWVRRNGLSFEDHVYTEEGFLKDGQTEEPVPFTKENIEKRYTTAVWKNRLEIPLCAWVACAGRAHGAAHTDYEKAWTDWFSHFTMDKDGNRYYDGKKIEA